MGTSARSTGGRRREAVALALVVLAAACGPTTVAPTPVPPSPTASGSAPSASPDGSAPASPAASASPAPSVAATPLPPIGARGSIVLVRRDGSLALVATDGTTTTLATSDDGTFSFPAWSPDGTRIAAVRLGRFAAPILVFDPVAASAPDPPPPLEVMRNAAIDPFYLAWSPDGAAVAYLADVPEGIALRLAPADGSASLDGSGPRSLVRTGSPFYFDWVAADRLFAHIETGPDAFLGEIGLDGEPVAAALETPGEFRAPDVSADGSHVAFVRAVDDEAAAGEVVLAPRDGGTERTLPVFGGAAVAFHPTEDAVATIGHDAPTVESFAFPFGPLRLLDAAGGTRTLLDGTVVAFWWSPDGTSIAALRVEPPAGGSGPSVVRLHFVDVEGAAVTASTAVQPAGLFVDQLLPFFDQYATSHRLWSPDSASFLLPEVGDDGVTRVVIHARDGGDPILLDGQMAFWSP